MKEEISDEKLLQWHARGLIPGPEESKESFLDRVKYSLPMTMEEEWKPAHRLTQTLFGIQVDWVPFTYSNEKLAFWEGAAFWLKENGQMLIQLRTAFRKGRFWVYDRTELLAHESVHAARLLFKERKFEEILAYQTSPSSFRKVCGPLFFQPWESIFLMCTTLVFLILDLLTGWPLIWGIIALWGYYANRLIVCRFTFSKCLKKVGLPVALGLTDREIEFFSRSSLSEIQVYLESDGSLRINQLRALSKRSI